MKKVTITLSSKDYVVNLDDEFASYFEKDMKNFQNELDIFDAKGLITAYVQKSFECYKLKCTIEKLNNKLDKVQINQKN